MSDPIATNGTASPLADEILESLFDANPQMARDAGLHGRDGRVADRGAGRLAHRVEELDGFLARLNAAPPADPTSDAAFEQRVLVYLCRRERYEIVDQRIWNRSPNGYVDELDITGYLTRDYAPRRERATALYHHLEGVGRLLDAARGNLDEDLDATILLGAQRNVDAWADFVEGELGAVLVGVDEEDDELRRGLVAARAQAARAARRFARFLEERRAAGAGAGTFAIGEDGLRRMLSEMEAVDVPLERIAELGRADLERNLDALREAAARIDPRASVADVMARVKSVHPGRDGVLDATRRVMKELREFIVLNDVVSIPSETPCHVESTPPFLAWAFAMMDGSPSLAPDEQPGLYYVTPPRPEWDDARAEEWLTEFSLPSIAMTAIHEAWPGHFLHGLHIRRNPSRAVRVAHSYVSAEAWAHYSEQLMVEMGYGREDPNVRLLQLGDALTRNVRLVASIGMHTKEMTVDEAESLFREKAFLAGAAARNEAERGTFDPGYLNYTLGKMMLLKLREDVRTARGDRFSLRAFHDDFLYWAMAPVPFVRERLLGPGAGPPL
jgi:uncharacterized protein (DUF885 family)